MKEVLLGKELKNVLRDRKINEIIYETYNGTKSAIIDSLMDEQIYRMVFNKDEVPSVVECQVFDSAKETIKFQEYINELEDEEAGEKTIVWIIAKGKVVKELNDIDKRGNDYGYYESYYSDMNDYHELDKVKEDDYYIIVGEDIYGYEK